MKNEEKFTAKPLFIVNKINQSNQDKNEFKERCQQEYETLLEILDDYHVLYFVENEPNPNWSNINNYDVKYPNKIPDIAMSELLELVEQNLSVDSMLEKLQIIKKDHTKDFNVVSFIQSDFVPNPLVHNGINKYRNIKTSHTDFEKSDYVEGSNYYKLKNDGWVGYFVDKGSTPPSIQFIVNLDLYEIGTNKNIDAFLKDNPKYIKHTTPKYKYIVFDFLMVESEEKNEKFTDFFGSHVYIFPLEEQFAKEVQTIGYNVQTITLDKNNNPAILRYIVDLNIYQNSVPVINKFFEFNPEFKQFNYTKHINPKI